MTEDDKIRAERAKQLLEDEVLLEAFALLERDVVDVIANTPVSDHTTLMALAAGLQATRALPDKLRAIIQRGTEPPAPTRRYA